MSCMVCWTLVPAEVFQDVCANLTKTEKATVRLVCQSWRLALSAGVKTLSLPYTSNNGDWCQLVSATKEAYPNTSQLTLTFAFVTSLPNFERNIGHLQLLNLCSFKLAGEVAPNLFTFGCLAALPGLTELRVTCELGFPSCTAVAQLSHLSALQLLDLRAQGLNKLSSPKSLLGKLPLHITDEHLLYLAQLTTLRSLLLNGIEEVTGTGILQLTSLTRLSHLCLMDSLNGRLVTASHLKGLSALPHLENLEISRLMQPPMYGEVSIGAARNTSDDHPWGHVLKCFRGLKMLKVKAAHHLEKQLLQGVSCMDLKQFALEVSDLPYWQLRVAFDVVTAVKSLLELRLCNVFLYQCHLVGLAQLTQLKSLQLAPVDLMATNLHGWSVLSTLTNLESFEFVEWNNPLLRIGNLCVLTDAALSMLGNCWKLLNSFSYRGKVSICDAGVSALKDLPDLRSLSIKGTDDTEWFSCIGAGGKLEFGLKEPLGKMSSTRGYMQSLSDSEESVAWMGPGAHGGRDEGHQESDTSEGDDDEATSCCPQC